MGCVEVCRAHVTLLALIFMTFGEQKERGEGWGTGVLIVLRWNSSSKCTLESVHYIGQCVRQNIHMEGERGDFRC
jgi:hypothetical protein